MGLFIVIDLLSMIYPSQDGHRDEAQAGRGPVRRRVRGHLEEVQHHHRCQDAQGKSCKLSYRCKNINPRLLGLLI